MARRRIQSARVAITGASSGIGRELAIQLAKRKCRLVISARRRDRLEVLGEEISQAGGEAFIVCGDITESDVRNQIVNLSDSEMGGLDVLINNAGVGAVGPFAEASESRLRQVMEVNFFAACELTRLSIPLLRNGNLPIVVNVSSVLGHCAVPLKSEYCASKFAIHGWSDSLRAELVDEGIDVLIVSPSTTDSEFFDRVLENKTGKNAKLSAAMSPADVASRTIRAIERGKQEIILSWSGWGLVWLDRLFPRLAGRLVSKFGK